MNVLVVGAGEMGTWFARTLRDQTDASLAFADRDSERARVAADSVGGRAVPATTDDRFDLVAIAVPIPTVDAAIEEWADHATRAMVDVSGVMTPAIEAMAEAVPERERVSFHPLFAADKAPGNVAVVADAPGPVTDEVRAALARAGNDCFETTAAEHDEAMETVQARVHAAVLAFGLAAEDVPEGFQTPVSGALFDVLDRVTGSDPRVYADIQAAFDGADDVAEAARDIAAADADQFAELYRRAAREDASDTAAESGADEES
jgi:prephenate dehydrogenase